MLLSQNRQRRGIHVVRQLLQEHWTVLTHASVNFLPSQVQEEVKVEETISAAESPTETAEVTTPTEANPASPNTATSPDNKETKKKEKMKKKWSFRSISFSKKDKNKPAREEAPKNGDVTKEEPLAELTYDELVALLRQAIHETTPNDWKRFCEHVETLEHEYWAKDGIIEDATEDLELEIQSSESNKESDDNSSKIYKVKRYEKLTYDELVALLRQAINETTPNDWKRFCEHVETLEHEYWAKDGIIEDATEDLELEIQSSESNKESDDNSSKIYKTTSPLNLVIDRDRTGNPKSVENRRSRTWHLGSPDPIHDGCSFPSAITRASSSKHKRPLVTLLLALGDHPAALARGPIAVALESQLTYDELVALLRQAINETTPNDWKRFCEHVETLEHEYWAKDGIIEDATEDLELEIQSSESNKESDDNSSKIYKVKRCTRSVIAKRKILGPVIFTELVVPVLRKIGDSPGTCEKVLEPPSTRNPSTGERVSARRKCNRIFARMESIAKAGRSVGSGVYRVAGAFARGARRVLSYVPLLGVTALPPEVHDAESSAGGEEAENGSPTAGSPVEEKSAVSSPTAENEAAPVAAAPAAAATVAATATAATATAAAAATAAPATESKEESAASAASSPTEEKTEEPTPSAPTPVPVEEKKEEVEKVEAEKKVVEVSPAGGQFVPDPVEVSVFRVQTVATPSIIERKTSEDIPSLPPSSPPPTPIDSSPLQQAQQAAATATALAEALKLPAEAADKDLITPSALSSRCPERNDPSTPAAESLDTTPHRPPSSPVLQPRTGSTLAPPSVEALPVVDTDAPNPPTPTTNNVESLSAGHVTVTELHDSKIANTDTHDPPSLLPTERPESPSCKANVVDQQRVKEIPLPEKSNLVDEMSTKADATLKSPTPNAAVEQLSQVTRVCDPSGARASESEACEDVVESVTKEIIVECESKKIPGPVDVKERVKEELVEEVIEPNEVVQEEIERVEEAVVDPPVPTIDAIVESEEGPIPASDETLVEAKPAVVIPEDEDMPETVENLVITVADTSRVDSEPVEVMAMVEDKLETETESDVAMPTEEILVCEVAKESKDPFVPNEATFAPIQPVNDPIIENIVDKLIDVPELTRSEEEPMPPPLPESPVPISRDKFDPESVNVALDSNTVPSLVVDVKPPILDVGNAQEIDGCPLSLPEQQSTAPNEFPDFSVPLADDVSLITLDVSSLNLMDEKEACLTSETQTRFSSCRLEEVPSPTDDLPPAPEDTVQQHTDSFKYPLPPEELSCPLNASEMNSELPVAVENAPSLRNPTETLPISPRTPSPVSNVSITSGLTASTKDSSQTLLYDDQSNREFKMESVSISLNSYNESDIELKERLAESLAETEKQEESSVSCQLSNNATSSTTIQETHQVTNIVFLSEGLPAGGFQFFALFEKHEHAGIWTCCGRVRSPSIDYSNEQTYALQSTPEPEAPVENNVAADTTTESSGEAIVKVTTPAVPSEVPATLVPSSPAITEDVASVAMVISRLSDFLWLRVLCVCSVSPNCVFKCRRAKLHMMIADRSFTRVSVADPEAINAV
ncbi:hypothetical protein WN48_04966 [Eufriesea mexicana]|nr:hypothetical protein WN48_04966 [Eufriesea mexicana]